RRSFTLFPYTTLFRSWQWGQVLSEAKNDPTTNCPGLIDVTSRPTSSTIPQYSWPNGVGCATGAMPRYPHRSEPQTHVAAIRTMADRKSTRLNSSHVAI